MRKAKKQKKLKKIKIPFYKAYQDYWLSVIQADSDIKFKSVTDQTFISDPFFNEAFNQLSLLSADSITNDINIDYTDFQSQMDNKIDPNNYFNGILSFIFTRSLNKLNTKEIEFRVSNKIGNKKNNILNIFSNNPADDFTIQPSDDPFFGFTLKTIKIQPIAYAIRSGPLTMNTTHLTSFTFEGFDEDLKKWVVLDERVNINDLTPTGGFSLFYIRSTDKQK